MEASFLEKMPQTIKANRGPLDLPPSHLPELRLVLLGRKGAGKSSAGNTILGLAGCFETSKPTEECVKRRGEVSGRRITVVDTPGWEWYYPVNGTPGWVRRETKRSVSLCPPGPHAVLLVVRSCTSVTNEYLQQINEHLELLGESVWDHTLVVFTRGDELGSVPIEQRIQNGGEAFQKLLEKCSNRFHVLENKKRVDDGSQVKELMRKMEMMIEEKGGRFYESDLMFLELEMESKRRARERRKRQRMMEAQTHRGTIRAVMMSDSPQFEDLDENTLFSRGSRRLPELRLVLLGERETGKSSAGNTILGGLGYFKSGEATEECLRQQTEVSNRLVTVVDAPGWEGGPEGITPERVKREIGLSVTLCPPGPHALLLALRVDALVQAQVVREHMELLGEAVWRHVLLLFTRGDQLREGVSIEQHIQGGGKELRWLMDRCSNRFHVISSISSSDSQIKELLEKIEKMVAGNRCEAFSPLLHEIQEMGRQKNEKLQVKIKEFSEKLQRQEEELRKMKEREVKSIRWFFERRKKDKVQSPGKAEREEVAFRGEDDRRSVMGELEERMAWLTEDKEREIQDLSAEMSNIMVNYHQLLRERDQLVMRLEEREREGEEKVDELQMKLLEGERLGVVKEQERKARDAETQHAHLEEVKKLQNKLIDARKEKRRMKEVIDEMQKEMSAFTQTQGEKVKLAECKVKEKDDEIETFLREIETMKLETGNKDKEHQERLKEMDEKKDKEMKVLREVIEMMTKEMEQLQLSHQEQVNIREAEREMHEHVVEKYNTLIDKLVCKEEEIEQTIREKEHELLLNAETQRKLELKEDEFVNLKQRDVEKDRELEEIRTEIQVLVEQMKTKEDEMEDLKKILLENDKEVVKLKQSISQKQTEIAQLRVDGKENAALLLKQLNEKEKEIETLQQNNQEKKAQMDILMEKQRMAEQLSYHFEEMLKESAAQLKDLKKELRKKEEELTKLRLAEMEKDKDIQTFREQQRDAEAFKKNIRTKIEKSAARIKSLEEELQTKEGEIIQLGIREMEKDKEITTLSEKWKHLENLKQELQEHVEQSSAHVRHLENELQFKEAKVGKLVKQELEKEQEMNINITNLKETHRKEIEKLQFSIQAKTEEDHAKIKEKTGEVEAFKERYVTLKEEMETVKKLIEESRLVTEMKENIIHQLEEQLKESESNLKELRKWCMEEEEQKENLVKKLKVSEETLGREVIELKLLLEDKERDVTELKRIYEIKLEEIQEKDDKEKDLQRQEKEVKKKEEEVALQKQHLISREDEIKRREQSLVDEKQNMEVRMDKITEEEKNLQHEFQNNKRLAESLEQMKQEIQGRWDGILEREENIKLLEQQIQCQNNELCAREKIMEKEKKELTEKQEIIVKNSLQQMEKREQKLMELKEKLIQEQQRFKEEEKTLETLKVNLEKRENEFGEMCEDKTQELLQISEKLQKDKQELEKKQSDLQQKIHALLQNEEQHVCRVFEQSYQKQQDIKEQDNISNIPPEGYKLELENIRKALGKTEHEVIKVEEAISQRGQKLNAEMTLDTRLQSKRKREEVNEKQNKRALQNLKKQQDILKDRKHSLDNRETHLKDSRDPQNQEVDLIVFEDKSQKLEVQKVTLKKKEEELDERQKQLHNREMQLNKEQEKLAKKKEELDKWEKYLYNKELKFIQKDEKRCDRNEKLIQKESRDDWWIAEACDTKQNKNETDFQKPLNLDSTNYPPVKTQRQMMKTIQNVEELSEDEDYEDFFEAPSSCFQPSQNLGASGSNPWRAEISGRHVTIVEPQARPDAFILVIPAFISITSQFRQAVECTMSNLGKSSWSNAIVLFTWGEALGESAQQHIKRNGDLERLVRKCGNRYYVIDDRHRENHVEKLLERVKDMLGGSICCKKD
ncbi:hypothetical protein DNTS_012038 [Danionella cerebrum]|uniref:AIG1-type G domain-containing protein n=1 Tax=Danionella cerebrum TaxID=2873325 RepID=A0A553MX56_9TELE|nr:hypothetical protein DNTS_012038 [Danionella translucida]